MGAPSVAELAALIRQVAAEEMLPRFTRVERQWKGDGTIVTEADLAVQSRIAAALAERFPDIPLLGEEMPEAEQQRLFTTASGPGVWILDPLDGTSNYAAGIPYFSISLALVRDGAVMLGIVYDPCRDELFSAVKGEGSRLNGEPLNIPADLPPLSKGIGLIDFKRLEPKLAARLASEPPYSSQRSFGSVALDWCQLAAGRCHAYLHGRQRLWDYAAGQLIFAEAGGFATGLEGERSQELSLDPRSAVAAPSRTLFEQWCRWLGICIAAG